MIRRTMLLVVVKKRGSRKRCSNWWRYRIVSRTNRRVKG